VGRCIKGGINAKGKFFLKKPLPPTFELLQSIRKLSAIVYLARLDAGEKVKVQNYMTDAERELERIKHVAMVLVTPDSPQNISHASGPEESDRCGLEKEV